MAASADSTEPCSTVCEEHRRRSASPQTWSIALNDRVKEALLEPPQTLEEYQLLLSDLVGGSEPKQLPFDESSRVWCISDLHVDCKSNMTWLAQVPFNCDDACIVAGDIGTSLKKIRQAFKLLAEKFRHVFFVAGNHELWTYRGGLNSVQKLIQVLQLCDESGVHVSPALLGKEVAVVPLQGWYGGSPFSASLDVVCPEGDPMCLWPECVGDPSNLHNSSFPRIADFFLGLNQRALSFDYSGRQVLSFGHFVPSELHVQRATHLIPILCCPQLSDQIAGLGSAVHVFGHSHENTDVIINGTRYVQNAIGHAKDEGYAEAQKSFVQIWPSITNPTSNPVSPLSAQWVEVENNAFDPSEP